MQHVQAPEILSFDQVEKTEGSREKTPVVRLGRVEIVVEKIGRRETDAFDQVKISLADLKRIAKEGYVLGWAGKCGHVETLLAQMTKEIGQ